MAADFQSNSLASLARISNWARNETYESGTLEVVQLMREAIRRVGVGASDQLQAFSEALDYLNKNSQRDMQRAHDQLARLMQSATIHDYQVARTTIGRNTRPYRLSSRDAGGRMLDALSDDEFCRGTRDGIGFGNVTLLDRTARQWHRLNFGARPQRSKHRSYPVTVGGLFLGAFGMLDEEPSAGFILPEGIWRSEDGTREPAGASRTGQFFPAHVQARSPQLGKQRVIPASRTAERSFTRGIEAWNFLDAGPRTLAQNIGPTYEAVYNKWIVQAEKSMGPFYRSQVIPSGGKLRPGTFSSRGAWR